MWFDDEDDETMGGQPQTLGFGQGFAGGMGQQGQQTSQQGLGGLRDLDPSMKMILMGQVLQGGDPFKAIAALTQMRQQQAQAQAEQSYLQGLQQAGGGGQGAPGAPGGPGGAPGAPGGAPQVDPAVSTRMAEADRYLKWSQWAAQHGRDKAAKHYMGMHLALKPTETWSQTPQVMVDEATGQRGLFLVSNLGNKKPIEGVQPERKVHKVITVNGPNGPVEVPVDEQGQPMGEGFEGYVKPELVDQGGSKSFQVPRAGQSFEMSMTPGQVDESKRGWAQVANSRGQLAVAQGNLSVAQQRLQQEKAQAQAGPPAGIKLEPGTRWNAEKGAAEPIPGSKLEAERTEGQARRDAADASIIDKTGRIITEVGEAKGLVGHTTSGVGAILANVPGTDAKNLNAKLGMVKANLGFAELQAMRDASPTGGALGQVAVQELVALQSTVAALDQAQSPKELKAGLDKVDSHLRRWQSTVNRDRAARGLPPMNVAEPKGRAASGPVGNGSAKQVKRTGKTADGRVVVEYTDGSREYR